MTRIDQHENNQRIIFRIKQLPLSNSWSIPSYRFVATLLNSEALTTSRGNVWTEGRLYRMLQREGYRGLHGLLTNHS